MEGRLREIAAAQADLSDQGRDGAAGVPITAPNGQGAGGKYQPLRPQLRQPAPPTNPKPFSGGK